jgi:DNA polymerase-3 subunit epsilon/ATP-dependent DNA helicase DinG
MGGVCPFYRKRQAAQTAHIIVVNHALLLADVATGNRVLPDYEYLVVDEAHHMESAVTNALSFRQTQRDAERILRELGGTNAGTLGRLLTVMQDVMQPGHYGSLHRLVETATDQAFQFQNSLRNFFVAIDTFLEDQREGRNVGMYGQQVRILPSTRTLPAWMDVEVSWDETMNPLTNLLGTIETIATELATLNEAGFEETEDVYGSVTNLFRRLMETHKNLNGLVFEPDPNAIYWAEVSRGGRRLALNAAPLHIGPLMVEHLWHKKTAMVLTSATLTSHGDFGYIRRRLEAIDAHEVQVGSPFDYESQAMLYVINDIPEPSDRNGHQRAVDQGLIQLARATGGRILALFTSYAQLQATAKNIAPALARDNITVLSQGSGSSPHTLVESFKETENAILLGTRSFWEGVDIPGDALSVLAIIKIPFDVPSDPIVAARSETFENAFQEYTLPEAILRFRQGFGRLIRTRQDRGVVVVFDRRLLTKMYGRMFVESLPPCTVKVSSLGNMARETATWLNL